MKLTKFSNRGILITLVSILMLTTASISAQKRKKSGPCANPQTQSEMNMCAGEDFKAADAVLNQVYQQLVAKLDDEEKALLKDAENAWLKYRDTNCEFVGDQYKGGTMRPMVEAGCLEDMTRKRTTELRAQIKERSQ